MTRFATLPAGMIALALAACGVAGAATIQSGSPLARAPDRLRCALIVTQSGGQTLVEGRVTAAGPAQGSYALRISQGTATRISQGGDFTLRAGEQLSLGQAQFSGSGGTLAASFTVESGGVRHDCPAAPHL
jgi:hypothetical protein